MNSSMETREGRFCICTEIDERNHDERSQDDRTHPSRGNGVLPGGPLPVLAGELHARREEGNLQRHVQDEQGDPGRDARRLRAAGAQCRAKLLGMLCASGVELPLWWWDVLVGEGDPLYREFEPLL